MQLHIILFIFPFMYDHKKNECKKKELQSMRDGRGVKQYVNKFSVSPQQGLQAVINLSSTRSSRRTCSSK